MLNCNTEKLLACIELSQCGGGPIWHAYILTVVDTRLVLCVQSYSDEDVDISSGDEVQAPVKKQKASNK